MRKKCVETFATLQKSFGLEIEFFITQSEMDVIPRMIEQELGILTVRRDAKFSRLG